MHRQQVARACTDSKSQDHHRQQFHRHTTVLGLAEDFSISIFYTVILTGWWFGLILWIQHNHDDSYKSISVIVFRVVILGLLTIALSNLLVIFIASALVTPFVIIHSIYALYISLFFVCHDIPIQKRCIGTSAL
jgi:hypothetical protein